MIKYKNEVHDPNLPNIAIENSSLKFLRFIWESTTSGENNNKSSLSIIKLLINKSYSSSSNSNKNKKRKSILIQNLGNNNFNSGKHSFTISDLINRFVEKKNDRAIKYLLIKI